VSSDAAHTGAVSPATNGAAPRTPELPPPPGSPYSGLATRALAAAIDVLIVWAVAWVVGAVAAVAASLFDPSQDLQTVLIAAGAVVATLWSAGYFVFFWSTTGQTPGDRVMEIRVQDAADGRPLHLARAVLRLLGALLSVLLLFLGYLMILVDGRRRALHDRLVGNVVVYAPAVGRRRERRPTVAPTP
jgi:uncharacterized RDD family membrane protein YckC